MGAEEQAGPEGGGRRRDVPRLGLLEDLEERRGRVWFSSHAVSVVTHLVYVAIIVQTGFTTAVYYQGRRGGNLFGQAVFLASPMFGAGSRGGGGNAREIPLSALVPEQRLVAPDLRNLSFRLPQSALPGIGAASEGKPGGKGEKGERGGGGTSAGYGGGMATALPDGLGVRGAANGPQISFDIVPPSNTRTRKSGEVKPVRVVLGDATVAGGGEAEGLRLPASPKRVGLSVEATVEPELASAMEQYLRLFLSRMRRTAFEAVPDSRGLGGAGEVVLVAEIGRIGRLQRTSIQTSSSNSQLDTAALQLLRQTPAIQALPDRYVPDSLSVKVIVRYR